MKFLRTLVVDDAVDGRISQTPHPATVLHPTSPLMPSVVAERFVENGRAWIDLASGVPVRLRIERAGDRAAQIVWSDRCADLARIRHPLMNVLVDYGSLTNETTFEAYSAGGPVGLTAPMASLMLTHATRFLKSRGHTLTKETAVLLLRGTTVAQVLDERSSARHLPSTTRRARHHHRCDGGRNAWWRRRDRCVWRRGQRSPNSPSAGGPRRATRRLPADRQRRAAAFAVAPRHVARASPLRRARRRARADRAPVGRGVSCRTWH